jgi:hypothetical protein
MRAGRGSEVRRILIDGRNVQRALARAGGSGSGPAGAGTSPDDRVFTSLVLAAVPPEAVTELLLDGFPSGGVVGRIGPRLRVEYTKGRSADLRIAELVERAAAELGPIGVDGVLVVSDDRQVGDQARSHGARVVGTAWLTGRIRGGPAAAPVPGMRPGGGSMSRAARAGTSLGHGRPPRRPSR